MRSTPGRSSRHLGLGRALSAGAAIASLAFVSCGAEKLYDDASGNIDLLPFFKGGATTADPTAGIPRSIVPTRGWTNGSRVEYLDFGAITVPRKLDAKGSALRVPDVAKVFPIYFFFDVDGYPLFSKPAFDSRTGIYYMRGGKRTATADPIDPPASDPERTAYYKAPNLLRPRYDLVDTDRGSADYQRPVIDTLLDDTNYSGLYEIVEVVVNDKNYQPDDIKSASTIANGVDLGRLTRTRTGKVINCPVIDDRTQIPSSPMANNVPRPRMEIWYRTRLGSCYLVNGWETIGEAVDENVSATNPGNLRLFHAGTDQNKRVDTFDVLRATIGDGNDQTSVITVPVAKLYVPTVVVSLGNASMDKIRTRYVGDDLTIALPKHKNTDPAGYSPITWMHDLTVPQDPPYQPGAYKDISAVDPAAVAPRDGDTTVVTRNYATIGPAAKCVSTADCKWGMQCNPLPDINIATTDPPPGMNLADVVIAREGGPRCDVPVSGFGGYCSPGVARCDVQTAAGGASEKALKALGVAVAGPTFTVHADLVAAQKKLDDTTSLSTGVDPANPTRMVTATEIATAMTAIMPPSGTAYVAREQAKAKADKYDALGFTSDYGGYGYNCFPPAAGYCEIRCDSGASSTATQVGAKLPVVDGLHPDQTNLTSYTFNTEARCGAANMLGYKCLPATVQPDRQRVCLRECNTMNTLNMNRAICEFPFNLRADGTGNANTAFSLGADSTGMALPAMTSLKGQVCTSTSLTSSGLSVTVTGCSWNPDFERRSPDVWPSQ